MAQQPSRRQYRKQFKMDDVELSLKSHKTTREIADDLCISPNVLYRWKGRYQASKDSAFPGTGNLKDAQAEAIRQLQRQLRIVTEGREILKKAFAVFTGKTP
jgi:transposase